MRGKLYASAVEHDVSILTRPEGRVPSTTPDQIALREEVSILTRPEGRVPSADGNPSLLAWTRFQSSPAPKGGCHQQRRPGHAHIWAVSILTRPEGRVPCRRVGEWSRWARSFNPHPPRRAGAMRG